PSFYLLTNSSRRFTEWSRGDPGNIDGQPIWAREREQTSQTPYNKNVPAVHRPRCSSRHCDDRFIEADRSRLPPQRWATLKAQEAPRRATLRPQIPSDFRPRKNLEQIRGQIVHVPFELVFLSKHFV